MNKKKGLFLSFEGPEAVGKSTQLLELQKFLKQTAYGNKIYIGMGAGSISNWMRNLKNNI